MQTFTIKVRWLTGRLAGQMQVQTRDAHNCSTPAEVAEFREALYPLGSTHSAPKLGRFQVIGS